MGGNATGRGLKDGLLSVLLGSVKPLLPVIFAGDGERWLGIQVDTDPELAPRQRVATVPYAFVADRAASADEAAVAGDADLLDGLDSTAFAPAGQANGWAVHVVAPTGPYSITTVDAAGNVGRYTSMAVGFDGFPVISYYDTDVALKVAHCEDLLCSSATVTTLDSGDGGGLHTSIAIANDGHPVVSYSGSEGLKVAHCDDIQCTGATTNVADPQHRGGPAHFHSHRRRRATHHKLLRFAPRTT